RRQASRLSAAAGDAAGDHGLPRLLRHLADELERAHRRRLVRQYRSRLGLYRDRGPAARDRKSTRLNSSNVSNSYAVFSLKKKNNGITKNSDNLRRNETGDSDTSRDRHATI